MTINIEEIIIKIKVTDQQKLKAIAGLDFGDFVIKGFRIMLSDYKDPKGNDLLWVTPPSYQDGGKRYHPIFFLPNKEIWGQLERKILDEYSKQEKEYRKKQFGLTDTDI